jgi:hypothetical protein
MDNNTNKPEIVKTKAVAKVKPAEANSVDALISQAVASGASVEVLERLFELHEKVKGSKAKEAFVAAMAKFQSEVPVIKKTKKVMNKDGRTVRYTFAPIESIVEQIKKPLVNNDFSYRWETAQEAGVVKATCIITHTMGHSEQSTFEVGIDTEGFMTAPQKSASALTFAKRYSLCNALGISTGDEDTDATDVGREKDAKNPKTKLMLRLRALGEKTGTKEEIEEAVKRLTQLPLEDKNLEEIVTRLEVVISDRQDAGSTVNLD